ncbi:MAG TPA: threonine/serine dehydratase, partial [Oculatellaceae cyanobacterium]
GTRVLIKAETLQKTGSFKFRGAYHFLSRLDDTQRKAGVVAYSSGNHAQAVACAAQQFGCSAWIVMPKDAPTIKIRNTQEYGATVIQYDRRTQSREAIAESVAQEFGCTVIPPFDHPHIIAGQGTVALEFIQQLHELGVTPHAFLAPISGGGLMAGCALAFKALSPETRLYAVEPEGYDDLYQSLQAGTHRSITPSQPSICDALLLPRTGKLTFPILQSSLSGGLTVTDQEIQQAMRFAFEHLKLVVEPGGAAALAALLSGRLDCQGKPVGIVLSGANVDDARFAEWIQAGNPLALNACPAS